MNHRCLVISSLACGGAERVTATLANRWVAEGRQVSLVTLGNADDFFPLDRRINRVALDLLGPSASLLAAVNNNYRRWQTLRRTLRALQPDVILSAVDCTNVLVLAATQGLGVPVVVAEHTDPRRHQLGRGWQALRRRCYPQAAAVVMLTEDARQWVQAFVPAARVHLIPNPVQLADAHEKPLPLPQPCIAALGRLAPEKGFDDLLRAFALAELPDWSLVIIGEGAERARLEQLAVALGITAQVHLPGQSRQPAGLLRQAELFALSSRYEGFPLALIEAMSLGLPPVAFRCSPGLDAIIGDGFNGRLIAPGDVMALAAALRTLATDHAERRRLGDNARAVAEHYSLDTIMEHWERLFACLKPA